MSSSPGSSPDEPSFTGPVQLSTSLEELQSNEQRRVLDIVAQIRKYGLPGDLSLPQIVVCGDQSAGKSSVLEALTEIPFPRSDSLCTRFATEITLQRASVDKLNVAIIPDPTRPLAEQRAIAAFSETISDFSELPSVIEAAKDVMGVGAPTNLQRSFSKDTLSITIEGPGRPHLTLVDVPGLIQTETKGSTKEDREMVARITEDYIKQPRTICLAVISATNDYANQPILTRVREVDPEGQRTLGIITKPDRLEPDSGLEKDFLDLARNQDIIFALGWHVVKNRGFQETASSLSERDMSERLFFETSKFKSLPAEHRGIAALRTRLSALLFEHVKRELPNLRRDLDKALREAEEQLGQLGDQRISSQECRRYLTYLSMDCLDITKKALDGQYRESFFQLDADHDFHPRNPSSIRRLRAVIQLSNTGFETTMRRSGSKYTILPAPASNDDPLDAECHDPPLKTATADHHPTIISWKEATDWVARVLVRSRGREMVGSYNPLIIAELYWEQSSLWKEKAEQYVEEVSEMCSTFMKMLLEAKCPHDVHEKVMNILVAEVLQSQYKKAMAEVEQIIQDNQDFPSVYNHYYTDLRQQARAQRLHEPLQQSIEAATQHAHLKGCQSNHTSAIVDVEAAARGVQERLEHDMTQFSCDDALDDVLALYQVGIHLNGVMIELTLGQERRKVFVANVIDQVIERHLIRKLGQIFSPAVVADMTEEEVLQMAGEPGTVRTQREGLQERIRQLKGGQRIFRQAMGAVRG